MSELVQVVAIYISPGHSYFGRHETGALFQERFSVKEVECVAGCGLVGDRFFGYKKDYKGQVTFFSIEVFERLLHVLRLGEADPSAVRRNVLTRGIDLNTWIGKVFSIQGLQFEGVEECRPCYWMDAALAPGACAAMRGHGGLRARVLTSGVLRVDA